MKTTRQLAAILFADIAGYTALMQKDEATARQMLDKFHFAINTKVDLYQGQVVNNYGDGCLCTFDSAVAAVQCAKELQEDFQSLPKVPVRIGLHSGDVFFEKDNVYGDSVNIASRIESMGVPGAILFSKKIRDEIKNQPDIKIKSLGNFAFKNVEEEMEVFALANEGYVVPKREEITGKLKRSLANKSKWLVPALLGVLCLAFILWKKGAPENLGILGDMSGEVTSTPLSKEVREKRVAILVFENKTGSEDLEDFGTMISDWITKGLMETEAANVISAANIQNQIAKAGTGLSAAKNIAEETGVGVLLQGRYYMQEGDLIIHANIVDAEKGEVIYALDPIQGPKSEMLKLLDELTQKILGYWAIKGEKRYLQNPPKYEAYQKFMEANKIWGDNARDAETEQLLIEAYQLDPTFYPSLLKLAVYYGNPGPGRSFAKKDSVFQLIENLNPSLTKWEKLRLAAIKASADNDYLKAAQLNEQMYRMDPSDEAANYNAGFYYMRTNMPQKGLEILHEFDQRFRDMSADFSWIEMRLAQGHFMLGEYDKVFEIAKEYPFPKILRTIAALHLRALVQMDSMDAINAAHKEYEKNGVYDFGGQASPPVQLLFAVCEEAYLFDKKEILKEYVGRYKKWTEENGEGYHYENNMAWAAFFLGDIKEALSIWEKMDVDPQNGNRYVRQVSQIGVCHAMLGNNNKAAEQLALVENTDVLETRMLFNMAKIQAAMGQNKAAVNTLKKAYGAGLPHLPQFWAEWPMLKPLLADPDFQELQRPKG